MAVATPQTTRIPTDVKQPVIDIPTSNNASVPAKSAFKDWPNDAGFHSKPQTVAPVDLKVTGSFPSWTAGDLLRTGPGANKVEREQSKDGTFHVSHWFDGFTTIHRFSIAPQQDGSTKVKYTAKPQVDAQIETARRTGTLNGISFGQKRDPCDSFYKKMKTMFEPTKPLAPDHECIGVAFAPAHHAKGRNVITNTSDRAMLKEIDLDTLEPKSLTSQKELNPALKGPLSAAHPCHDPKTGDLYNYNLDLGPSIVYRIFRTSAKDGKTDVIATLSGSDVKGAYIHSFFLTENFVILCLWPAFIANMGISILWERNIFDALEPFNKNAKCTWFVIDRTNGRGLVKKFKSPAMFSFHTANAWEEVRGDGTVDLIADICQFDNLDILHKFYYENLMSSGSGAPTGPKSASGLARYRLPAVPLADNANPSKKTTVTVGVAERIKYLTEPLCGDLPVINGAYRTKPSRYIYTILNRGLSSFIDAVGKTDTETGECQVWACDKHTPGEPIFVANPEGTAEDDGVLLIAVLDGVKETSYLLCLDARTMREIARAECEVPVGFGFHGVHLKAR